jgi:hypothetical protein
MGLFDSEVNEAGTDCSMAGLHTSIRRHPISKRE